MAADPHPLDDRMDDDPFALFTEWGTDAYRQAYAEMEVLPDLSTPTEPRTA